LGVRGNSLISDVSPTIVAVQVSKTWCSGAPCFYYDTHSPTHSLSHSYTTLLIDSCLWVGKSWFLLSIYSWRGQL
jgi:hypothetical protein